MTRKLYTGSVVDVSFDRDVCQHAAECVHGLPSVFDVHERPWINLTGVDNAEKADFLRVVVGRCPSGALHMEEHQAVG